MLSTRGRFRRVLSLASFVKSHCSECGQQERDGNNQQVQQRRREPNVGGVVKAKGGELPDRQGEWPAPDMGWPGQAQTAGDQRKAKIDPKVDGPLPGLDTPAVQRGADPTTCSDEHGDDECDPRPRFWRAGLFIFSTHVP